MNTNTNTRLVLFLMLLLVAAALVACGGDEAAEAPEAPAATEAVAEVTPVEEAPAEPTAAPPTTEPTAAPPTAAPTEAPTEPAAPLFATGYCGHAFYPVVDGRVLHFTTNSTLEDTSEYTTTYSNVTDSSFTLSTDVGDDMVIAVNWQCSADGLLSPEFSQLPGGMEGMDIEFTEASGISIPSEEMFQVGESWPLHYVANATMAVGDDASMQMQQTFDLTNTVTAIEAISVPAGDFPNAVRVETTGSISTAVNMGGQQQPGVSFDMNYTSWYAEGVGLVRQEMPDFFGTGSNYITELVSVD